MAHNFDRFIVVRYGTLQHFVLIMNYRASKKLVGMLFLLSYKMKESGFSAEIGICQFCLHKEIMHFIYVSFARNAIGFAGPSFPVIHKVGNVVNFVLLCSEG